MFVAFLEVDKRSRQAAQGSAEVGWTGRVMMALEQRIGTSSVREARWTAGIQVSQILVVFRPLILFLVLIFFRFHFHIHYFASLFHFFSIAFTQPELIVIRLSIQLLRLTCNPTRSIYSLQAVVTAVLWAAQPRPSIPAYTASTQRRGSAISVLCCSNAGSVSSAGAGPTISDALATIVADSSVRSTRALARHPSDAFNKGSSAGGSGSSRTRVANYGAATPTSPASVAPPAAGASTSQATFVTMRRGYGDPCFRTAASR
jgi:hypothetical protein